MRIGFPLTRLNDLLAKRHWPLLFAFFCSGAGALGFELLWVRQLGIVFGAESLAVLAVLAGFFAGLALGAAALNRAVVGSRHPVRIYAFCELLIASYGLLLPWLSLRLLTPLPSLLASIVGDNQSTAALMANLAVSSLLLLPATVPMGVTTVALVEAWRRSLDDGERHYSVGRLYAANTLGATVGILASSYWLLPRAGTIAAAAVLSATCLLAGLIATAWQAWNPVGGLRQEAADAPRAMAGWQPESHILVALFATGLAGIGFEAVGTQILAQIFENTVYTFANVLAIYLVGTSIGAWLYTRPRMRIFAADRERCTLWLLYALAVATFISMAVLARAPRLLASLVPPGSSYTTYVTGEIAVTALVFLLPTLLMGATFSHLLGQLATRGVGHGYGVNTLGGAIAPFLFGLVLIPRVGYGAAVMAIAAVYFLVFSWLYGRRSYLPVAASAPAASRVVLAGAIVTAVLLAAVTYTPLVLVRTQPGYRLLAQARGLHGTVSVSERPFRSDETATTLRLLQVNQNFLMGGGFGYLEKRIGHLSLLLAREPRDVLFLGVGTGITAGAALAYPEVERITAVELVPEILGFLDWFADANEDLANDPRVRLHASDARRFLQAAPHSFDLVVGELFHPTVNGAGSLYTREHFSAVRRHLEPGGLFVQWLPLYQLAPRDLATVVRTFLAVFPDAHSLLGTYSGEAALALFAWESDPGQTGIDIERLSRLLKRPRGPREVVSDEQDLLAAYMTDAEGLQQYAGTGPLNTDLNQRILFDAPLSLGGDSERATYRSLAALLPYRRAVPERLVHPAGNWRTNLETRAQAVTRFLAGEIRRLQAPRSSFPAAAVDDYLAAYEADPAFQNVRQVLLEIAGRHPDKAADILGEMSRRNAGDRQIARAFERVRTARGDQSILAALRDYLQAN